MAANLIFDSMVAEAKRAELMARAERDRLATSATGPRRGLRRVLAGIAAAGLLSLTLAGGAAAHDGHHDDAEAYAGNGGVAVGEADGGVVLLGDLTTGENAGGEVGVGDVADGAVAVEGGDVASGTFLGVSADGGVGLADASGGDENLAVALDCDGHDRDGRLCD